MMVPWELLPFQDYCEEDDHVDDDPMVVLEIRTNLFGVLIMD